MNRLIIYIALIAGSLFPPGMGMVFGQEPVQVERSDNKVVIEGKVYYVHVVKPGQTLYSIGRTYNVSVKELLIENPGVTVTEIRLGQVLKIPADPTFAFSVDTQDEMADTGFHVIAEGETVYSISRKYGCTVESIVLENPGLDIDNLQVGQAIRIPVEQPENEYSFDEEGIILHKVKRRETLFSISRFYGVTVSEIKKLNPELGWGGPRTGAVLKIPQPNTTREDVFTKPEIEPADSLPASDTVKLQYEEPIDLSWMEDEEYNPDKMYRVAYLVPFDYSEPVPLDTLLKDVKSALRRKRITEQYALDQSKPGSVNFLEFIEGSLMAVDSLTDSGLNIEISILDTRKSMYFTRKLMSAPEMVELDLIIGPFYSYNLEIVSEFSRQHRIPLVTPFYSGDSLLHSNPWLFQATPSYQVEYARNAAYIARQHDKSLILVHDGDSSEWDRISYYKDQIINELKRYSADETVVFKEVILQDGNTEELVHALNADMENIVILPSRDEAFASQVSSRLFYLLNEYDIRIFGSRYFVGFDDIQLEYVHALQLLLSHTNRYDYNDPNYDRFLSRYRTLFFREPSSFTRMGYSYAATGYNLSYYFLSAMQRYGKRFLFHLDKHHPGALLYDYEFERTGRRGGFENRLMNYYKYNRDLTVDRIDLPVQPPVHYYLLPAEEHFPLFLRQRNDPVQSAEEEEE